MSHNQRRYTPAGAAIHTMDIAAADSTGLYFHQHIRGAKLIKARRRSNGMSAAIHVLLGLDQQQLRFADAPYQ